MSRRTEIVEAACKEGIAISTQELSLQTNSTAGRPISADNSLLSYPIYSFVQLAFLYARSTLNISFVKFLFNYEVSYYLYYQKRLVIDIYTGFRLQANDVQYNTTNEEPISDTDKFMINFDLELPIKTTRYIKIGPNQTEEIEKIRQHYIELQLGLLPSYESIKSPVSSSSPTKTLSDIEKPGPVFLRACIQRPSLCLYARIAHHVLRQDNFIDEFMRACTARIDTVEARANATFYTKCPTGEEPTNWFSPPNPAPIELAEPWGNEKAKTNMSRWVKHYEGGGTHVITRSVEPLVAALISAYPTTIEFVGKESSIDVAYLRESIINGAWCGRIYDDDKQCHNMLTFLTLLLIASSSGIPMYASRGWTVVSKVWRDMVRTIQGDRWLARYTEATTEATAERKTQEHGVEINEERLLELAIKVIAITHVSEQKVQGFKPGALGYVRYVEKFYDRMVKEDVLGQVKTKPWADEGNNNDGGVNNTSASKSGESSTDKVNDPTLRFARRVRFMQEFSYPRDMDDLRDAVRFRLAHWLVLKPTQIQFV